MKLDDDLLLYWSNELETSEREAVEARLRDDPEASAYLEELEGLAQAMETLPRSQAPHSLTRRTLSDLGSASEEISLPTPGEKVVSLPRKPWFTHWMAIAAGLMAAAALIFLYPAPRSSTPKVAEQNPSPEAPVTANESPAPSPPSRVEEDPAPARSRVASRLFAKESRFTSNGRFRAARERLQKLRSQLPTHSSPNEKA